MLFFGSCPNPAWNEWECNVDTLLLGTCNILTEYEGCGSCNMDAKTYALGALAAAILIFGPVAGRKVGLWLSEFSMKRPHVVEAVTRIQCLARKRSWRRRVAERSRGRPRRRHSDAADGGSPLTASLRLVQPKTLKIVAGRKESPSREREGEMILSGMADSFTSTRQFHCSSSVSDNEDDASDSWEDFTEDDFDDPKIKQLWRQHSQQSIASQPRQRVGSTTSTTSSTSSCDSEPSTTSPSPSWLDTHPQPHQHSPDTGAGGGPRTATILRGDKGHPPGTRKEEPPRHRLSISWLDEAPQLSPSSLLPPTQQDPACCGGQVVVAQDQTSPVQATPGHVPCVGSPGLSPVSLAPTH